MRLMRAVIVDFFAPQHTRKGQNGIKPVVNVEHPLDSKIPFDPNLGKIYHRFFPHNFRTIDYLFKLCGRQITTEVAGLLDDLRRLYSDSAWVYRRVQTTTPRPPLVWKKAMITTYIFDPHLHCIPSLHVSSVYRAYSRTCEIAKKYLSAAEARLVRELSFLEATIITESILFVKQHSVNCISATFLALNCIDPFYTDEKVKECIEGLFVYSGAELPCKNEIRTFLYEKYNALKSQFAASGETDWRQFMVNWVSTFPAASWVEQ